MKTKVNKGLRLGFSETAAKGGMAAQSLFALLLYFAVVVVIAEFCGVEKSSFYTVAAIAGVLLTAAAAVLGALNKEKLFYIGSLLLLLVLVIVFRGKILDGARIVYNSFCDTYLVNNGTVLQKLQTASSDGGSAVFAVFLAVVLYAGCAVTVKYIPAAAAVLPVVLLACSALTKVMPTFFCIILALTAGIVVTACGGKNVQPVKAACSAAVCIVLAVALLAVSALPQVKAWAEKTSENIHNDNHIKKYETEYTTLPEGDLTALPEEESETVPALVVTMENPEEMYFRGFVGCTYENGVWQPVSNAVLAENSELLYWLNSQEFNPAAQFEAAVGEGAETSLVTVQNIGACSEVVYVPFSVSVQGFGEYFVPENLHTDSVFGGGSRTYAYSVVSGGGEAVTAAVEMLQASDDEAVLEYRRAESAYRQFVHENYMTISEEDAKLLENAFDELGIAYGEELTAEEKQESALKFLSLCFEEGGKADELELPLNDARGTNWQHTTVGTLVFRYFGVPARYAEGYIISAELAGRADSNESITVDSSCASSWIEVYQDGAGWLPLAFTPGLGEMTEEQQSGTTQNQNSTAPKIEEGEELEEEPQTEENDPQPDGGSLVTLKKAIMWSLIIIIAAIILLIVLLIVRRKLIMKRRFERFADENVNDAVGWIFADAAVLLDAIGLDREGGSVTALYGTAAERFGDDFGEQLKQSYELSEKALFSAETMDEAQRESAMDFRNTTAELLKENEKPVRRLWTRGVRCLY
ncbi:MAG: transglutaminase domain-containing protein [Oscillospiraceae bacterium]|nr:transglutaminase domain-containing protein [Oscillospiraceae bacterium]